MALAEAARFANSFEAGAAKALLESAGIGCVLFDMEMSWEGMGGIIPIRLMVLGENLDAALEVLAG